MLGNKERNTDPPCFRFAAMSTTAAATCDAFVAAASEFGLLSPEGLEQVGAYLRAFPRCGAEDLAAHLIEQGALTRFQANAVHAGAAGRLVLAQYTLVDVIGEG